jgi:hypothetical protein
MATSNLAEDEVIHAFCVHIALVARRLQEKNLQSEYELAEVVIDKGVKSNLGLASLVNSQDDRQDSEGGK